jgi:hypothetical protein
MKIRVALVAVALLALLSTTLASAETFVQSSGDARLVLGLVVSAPAAQASLPPDWQPAPPPSGPSTAQTCC